MSAAEGQSGTPHTQQSRRAIATVRLAIYRAHRAAGVFDDGAPSMTPREWCEELRRQVAGIQQAHGIA